jgi:hypothetical protein
VIQQQEHLADWPQTVRRYLIASIAGHLAWEIFQLPLYTLWSTHTLSQQTFAILHCTVGDAMIAALTLVAAIALFARADWPHAGFLRVYATSLAFGVGYTIFSEWLNTSVRGSWAYSDVMPVVPFIGTGMTPLLQWFVVPTLAWWFAVGRPPWKIGAWPSCDQR